jgi:hypothetical protein
MSWLKHYSHNLPSVTLQYSDPYSYCCLLKVGMFGNWQWRQQRGSCALSVEAIHLVISLQQLEGAGR